jgi:hypothetical protein
MGGRIGKLWSQAGHEVLFSSRNPQQLTGLTEGVKNATVGTVAEAIAFGEVMLLAVSYWTIGEALAHLEGSNRVIIDLTNPYKWSDGSGLVRVIPETVSGAEALQSQLVGATIVKAFSSHPSASLARHHAQPPMSVLYTCNAEAAKPIAERLISDAGFAPLYYGGLGKSRDIELFGKFSNRLMTLAEAQKEIKN